MIRRADITVLNDGTTPEPNVYITVKDALGAVATIYDDNGNVQANPFQSGLTGAFSYNIPFDAAGIYNEEFRLSLSDTPRKIVGLDLEPDDDALSAYVADEVALAEAAASDAQDALAAMTTALANGGADVSLRSDLALPTGFALIKSKSSLANTFARTAAQSMTLGTITDGVTLADFIDPSYDDELIANAGVPDLATSFTNANSALATIQSTTGRKTKLAIPAFQLPVATQVTFSVPDLVVEGYGATIYSTLDGKTVAFNGDRMAVLGLGFNMAATGADPAPYMEVNGAEVLLNTINVARAAGAHIPMYVRSTASGLNVLNSYFNWYGGINCFDASRLSFLFNKFINPFTANDDAIAIKAMLGEVYSILVAFNYFEKTANMIGIGSEIGNSGANDATFSKGVYGTRLIGNHGRSVGMMLYVKPGGASADYRDGTVGDTTCSGNVLRDPTGLRFQRGIALTPGRGGRVIGVKGEGNIVEARAMGTEAGGHKKLVDYWLANAGNFGSGAALIDDVDVGIELIDPFRGVANGTATPVAYNGLAAGSAAPGYPTINVVNVQNDIPGNGSMSRIVIDRIVANGCNESGAVIGANLDNAVTLGKLNLTNANAGAFAGLAGLYVNSAVAYRGIGDIQITVGGGSTIKTAGSGALNASIGFLTGTGGSIVQATNKSTAVTLNKSCGQITMNNAALAGGALVSFTLNNSQVAADDRLAVWVKSGNASVGSYRVAAEGNSAGTRTVVVENKTGGSLSEALVLGFEITKAVIT